MPELPEVETVVRALNRAVLGARIRSVKYVSARVSRPNPRGWKSRLESRTIDEITRRGKYIVCSFAEGGHLIIHLRMTGRLHLQSAGTKRGTHDRLALLVDGGPLTTEHLLTLVDTRQFARADFIETGSPRLHPGIAKLGPEADKLSESELRRILARSHRPVKSLLLDQTALAGLGNIYADESLHVAGIHPLTPCDLIDRGQVRRLRLAMQRILAAAIEACGTTFDTFSDLEGSSGGFAPFLAVYSRNGESCRRCGTTIGRVVLSGRSAHFCPCCQPMPAA